MRKIFTKNKYKKLPTKQKIHLIYQIKSNRSRKTTFVDLINGLEKSNPVSAKFQTTHT